MIPGIPRDEVDPEGEMCWLRGPDLGGIWGILHMIGIRRGSKRGDFEP